MISVWGHDPRPVFRHFFYLRLGREGINYKIVKEKLRSQKRLDRHLLSVPPYDTDRIHSTRRIDERRPASLSVTELV